MKPLLMFALAALASAPVAARSPQVSAVPDIGRKLAPDRPGGGIGATSPDGLPDLSQLAPDAVHINPDLAMHASQLLAISGALTIVPTPHRATRSCYIKIPQRVLGKC